MDVLSEVACISALLLVQPEPLPVQPEPLLIQPEPLPVQPEPLPVPARAATGPT